MSSERTASGHDVASCPTMTQSNQYKCARLAMAKNAVAKLFRNGRSQAVRLPREFRFEGDRVRIRRTDQGVLLEPLISDAAKWFEELDRFDQERFMVKGRRNQPI